MIITTTAGINGLPADANAVGNKQVTEYAPIDAINVKISPNLYSDTISNCIME